MDLLTKGWECPKCGAVMSPITSVCVNCRGKATTGAGSVAIKVSDDRPDGNTRDNIRIVDPRLYN